MALAGQQPRGGVETDPAGPGDVGLRPGVQIGEVLRRAGRAVERLCVGVGGELDQVARGETGGQAEPAQRVHEQPGAVAARADAGRQRLLGGLHAGLHAYRVVDVGEHPLIERDEEVDDRRGVRCHLGQPLALPRTGLVDLQVRRQIAPQRGLIGERPGLRAVLDEEVERVDHRHVGHEVDGDAQLARPLGEHEPREVVAEGILLPVEEVLRRRHLQRIGQDRRAAVRRWAQAHDVRPESHRTVIAVVRTVLDGDTNAHGAPRSMAGGGGCRRCLFAAVTGCSPHITAADVRLSWPPAPGAWWRQRRRGQVRSGVAQSRGVWELTFTARRGCPARDEKPLAGGAPRRPSPARTTEPR